MSLSEKNVQTNIWMKSLKPLPIANLWMFGTRRCAFYTICRVIVVRGLFKSDDLIFMIVQDYHGRLMQRQTVKCLCMVLNDHSLGRDLVLLVIKSLVRLTDIESCRCQAVESGILQCLKEFLGKSNGRLHEIVIVREVLELIQNITSSGKMVHPSTNTIYSQKQNRHWINPLIWNIFCCYPTYQVPT